MFPLVITKILSISHHVWIGETSSEIGLNLPAGGYNGNNFHTFIEGIVPLFITARHYEGEVILMISDSHDWWLAKFKALLQGGLLDHSWFRFQSK
jgi:hypothetical protein